MNISQILSDLTAERNRLDQAIDALEGSGVSSRPRRGRPPKSLVSQPARRKWTMSASARARISAAQKARWAKQKGTTVPKKVVAPTKKANTRKPMSPAAKKKLSVLAKARWAAAKQPGATFL